MTGGGFGPRERARYYEVYFSIGVSLAWANMPAPLTEFVLGNSQRRRFKDIREFREWRLEVGVAVVGSASAVLGVQFSNDGGTTFFGLDNGTSGTNSTVTQNVSATGNLKTAWTAIDGDAQIDDCLLRIVGQSGDGVADPSFTYVILEFR